MTPSATDDGSPGDTVRPPLVSIGASAGGVTALQAFFEALPERTGAAFVVVVHLDPEHASDMSRIIASRTSMPVVEVVRDQPIEPDKVYVIPPNRRLLVSADQISSAAFDEPRGQRAPIDQFFRSVADQHGDGFAVILTGGGADGTVGVKAIKEAGGLILVQDPGEAEYPSMPQSAIASGVADFVLPVKDIARRLPELIHNKQQLAFEDLASKDDETLRRILLYLRHRTGHDFSHYKRATVGRRLARRMQVTHTDVLQDYLSYLQAHPNEVQALLADLLISVTSFFRDSGAFEELAEQAIKPILDQRDEETAVRVWVPGCATGEEVYSIAMLMLEQMEGRHDRPEFQIFASDLDAGALATAREGLYPLAIRADVSEARLRRFFTREGESYRIRREVRDLVVFAQHSLLRDPPFSHIDLISCRNLLIYLDRGLQSQLSGTFHYALRPGGYLFLGSSESIDTHGLFRVVSRDARIFQSMASRRALPPLPRLSLGPRIPELPFGAATSRDLRLNYAGEHRQALEQLGVPSMLVDNAHRILNLSENAGRFLLPPGGPLTNIADDVVRPELRLDLQAGLHRAFDHNEATVTLPLAVKFNGTPRQVSLHVSPFTRDSARSALVLFIEGGAASPPEEARAEREDGNSTHIITQLRNELATTQGHLHTTRAQYEAVTEELRASNEELQSINEEYRSTAEELETSKEELQSINEELQTLNNELKLKLDVVSRAHNDLQNLMSATDVATLFLTTAFKINRFTPSLSEIFNVAPGDEGRPISNFTHSLDYSELVEDAKRVLADLVPVERVLKGMGGRWYLMRIRPYRTLDERIEGVVATFVDVTDQREAETKWEARQQLLINELSHRVRNTLSVVQAVVNQTLRSRHADPVLQQTLSERLRSIAKTHEMIVQGRWSGAELGAIAREQLAPYLEPEHSRVTIEGPPATLPSETATAVGLLVHELATNAVKHGALSQSGGNVRLSWALVVDETGQRVKMVWHESGGPSPAEPGTSGFGTSLIENGLPEATVHREFRPEGLVCTIEFPLKAPRRRSQPDLRQG
jgi:two-component system, chemotaxis family, CheB/CheR fusion protein